MCNTIEMFKWNNILFLIFLVPPIKALGGKPLSLKADMSSILFKEIDDKFSKLSLNYETLQLHYKSCPSERKTVELKDLDVLGGSTLVARVKDKFQLLQMHLHSQNLAKECPNMAKNVQEYERAQTINN